MARTLLALPFLLLPLATACTGADDDGTGDGDPGVDAPFLQRPETSITAAPPELTNVAMTRFELASDNPAATFECTIDGRLPVECGAVYEVELPHGPHRLSVIAIAAPGVYDLSPAVHEWRIDTIAPVTSLTSGPAGVDNSAQPVFWFEADEEATFACDLDGGGFAPCAAPHQTAPLAEGEHTFVVRATDLAGNVDETPVSRTWRTDFAPPDTTIESGPPPQVAATEATFVFSSPDAAPGSTFECRVDGGGFAACTSPHLATTSGDGAHTFAVRVVEPAALGGAVDPTPAMHMWSVDTAPPTLSITGGPAGTTSQRTPSFSFASGADAVARECRILTPATTPDFAPCTSPFTAPTLADGPYTFSVRVRDQLGNAQTRVRDFIVDGTPPVITISGAAVTNDNSPTFTFTASESVTTSCSIDHPTSFDPCTSPYTPFAGVFSGQHLLRVRANDLAGNVVIATFPFTVDTSAPFPGLTGPSGNTADNTPTFTWPVETGVTYTCRLNGAPFAPCTPPADLGPLADGAYTFTVQGTDAAGNTGSSSRAFTVNTEPLSVTFLTGPTGVINDRTPSFTWSTTGSIEGTDCRYDANPYGACALVVQEMLADGPHTLAVRITDDLGNSFVGTRSFTVDTVAPSVTFTGGPSGTITEPEVTFTFQTSGEPVVTECRLYRQGMAAGPYAACSSPHAVTLAPPTLPYPYQFEVRVVDAAGNPWSAYRDFTLAAP